MSALPDLYDGPDDIPVCPICGSEDVDWVEQYIWDELGDG